MEHIVSDSTNKTNTNTSSTMFRRIGHGFCVSVWTADDEGSRVIKREDGGPGRSVYEDCKIHRRILQSLSDIQTSFSIPACHQYIFRSDQAWWNSRIRRFPEGFLRCPALVTERIPPLPHKVRETIIDRYCPESLKATIKQSDPDRDCLIRPYLGRRRRLEVGWSYRESRQSRFHAFSLRNYPLHTDQMEELGLDVKLYARIMGETLADLFWRARTDANHIEFVLAPPRWQNSTCAIESKILGEHAVWILDFDCCRIISLDEAGVEQAVNAFYKNAPFYPRPGREINDDQALWNEFKDRFLEVSEKILGGSSEASLPARWVELVEKRSKPWARYLYGSGW